MRAGIHAIGVSLSRGRTPENFHSFSTTFDAVVSGLVLNFISKPEQAVAEMKRVLGPGGTCPAYVWDYAGVMQLLRHFLGCSGASRPSRTTIR